MSSLNPNSPETKVPALPAPQSPQQLLQALKELVEVREGVRGNPLDQNVTWRELVKSGLANIVVNGQQIGGSDPTFPLQPGGGQTDLTPPPQPVGLTATGAFQNVILGWNDPGNPNIALTEVWRSATNVAPDVSGSTAVLVGTTEAYLYADEVGLSNATRYYWVRFRSRFDIEGPYSAGVAGATGLVGGVDLSDGIVTASKIASGAISAHEAFGGSLRPVTAGSPLPTLPDTKYPAGALFFLTTDSKLYRSTGSAWVVNVSAGDVSGQLSNSQIADLAAAKITGQLIASQISDASLTTAKFASGIQPVTIVSSVPGSKSTETVFNTADGKLYRWNGSSYTAAVPTIDLTGQISDAQIAALNATKIQGTIADAQIAGLAASKVTGQLTNSQIADLAAAKISGQLTNAQLADIAASKVTGQIVEAQIANAAVSAAKFASSIQPVTIVSSVPGTKSTETIFNTTDRKLYRWNGTAYVSTVPTTDLTGTVTDAQIAGLAASKVTGQLTNSQIADLAATKVTGQLTNAQIADLAATKISGQLSDTQLAAISAAKVTGQIVEGQIANAAITLSKFASAIKPVEIVSTLPTIGNVAGRVAFLTTDNKLYRHNGTAWVSTVPTTDLTGTVTDAQIAGLAASKVTGQLSDSQISAVSATKVSGQLTNAQLADIAATKVTGQLVDSQLSALSANKVTGQLTNAQIASVEAAKVTGQLSASQLNVQVGGGNLLANSGFEGDANNDGLADGWSVFAGGSGDPSRVNSVTRVAGAPGVVGSFAQRVEIVSTGNTSDTALSSNTNRPSVVAGQSYVISAHIRASVSGKAYLLTRWRNASNVFTDITNGYVTVANSWTRVFVPATAPAGAVNVEVQVRGINLPGEWFEVDGVQVEAGNLATAYAPLPAEILPGTITATQIADNAITAPKIITGAIVSGKIAANAVGANEIAAGSITTGKIAAGAVTAGEIAAGAITTGKIAAGAVTATELAAGSVVAGKIATNAVTAAEIASGSITTAKIAAGAVTAGEIAAGAVTTPKISAGAVTATEIAAGAVVAGKIAANAVTATQIASGSITTAKIAAGAVTASEIASGAITTGKLAAGAVTANELAANAVTAGKVAAGAISATEISANAITASKLAVIDTTNLVKNPSFDGGSADGWTLGGANTILTKSASGVPSGAPSEHVVRVPILTSPANNDIQPLGDFDVRPGEVFYVEFSGASDAACNSTARIFIRFTDQTGTGFTWPSTANTPSNAQTWTRYSGYITVPATFVSGGTTYVPAKARIGAGTIGAASPAGAWFVTKVVVRRAASSELIVDGSVIANKVAAGAITAGKIAAGAVTANEIAANAVTATQLSAGAVTTAKIAAGAVTANEIAANAVTASQISAGAVTTAKIAAGSVTANEIAANAITTPKISAGAVTTATIAAGAVTATAIASGAVTTGKLAAGSVTANEIAGSAITAGKIAAGAVSATEIAANTITASRLLIGSKASVHPDPQFYDSRFWANTASWPAVYSPVEGATYPTPLGRALKIVPTGAVTDISTEWFPVERGGAYRTRIWIYLENAVGEFALRIHWPAVSWDQMGVPVSGVMTHDTGQPRWDFATIGQNDWKVYDNRFTNPSSVVTNNANRRAQFRIMSNLTSGAVYIGIEMVRAASADLIVDGAITAVKIAAGAITTSKLAAGAVTANEIAANAVTATQLSAGAVTTAKIAAGAVTAGEIAAGAVTTAKIAAGAVTAAEIAAGSIQTSKLAAGAVTANEIAANAVTAQKIAAQSVAASKLVLSDLSNIVPDAEMSENAAWGGPVTWETPPSAAWRGARVARLDGAAGSYVILSSKVFPVEAGGQLYFSTQGQVLAGAGSFGTQLRFSASADMSSPSYGAFVPNTSTTLVTLERTVLVPANMKYARIEIYKNNDPSTSVRIGGLVVRRAASAEMIVDGSISADKVAANAITTGKIAAGAITASQIASAAVRAQHLLVAPRSLNPDPTFASGGFGWDGLVRRLASSDPAVPTGCPVPFAAEFSTRDGWFKEDIDVVPGEVYRLSLWVNRGTGSGGVGVGGFGRAINASGGTVSAFMWPGTNTTAVGWTRVTGLYTIPANAARLRFGPWADRPAYAGEAWYADVSLEKVNDASLIVNGAITAEKIATNAVTADKILANAVTADKILAGEVTTTKLSILTKELVNPSSITNTLNGWGSITESGAGSNPNLSFNATEGAIQLRYDQNLALRSDTWAVNHDKIYRVSVKVRKDLAGGEIYIGASAFTSFTAGVTTTGNAVGTMALSGYDPQRVFLSTGENFYFLSSHVPNNDQYRSLVLYVVGANRDVNDCPAHSVSAFSSGTLRPFVKLPQSGVWAAIRILNWANNGTTRNLFIKDISVTEVGTGQIVASNIAANTITGDRIAAGTISAANIATGTLTADRLAAGTITAASGVIANAAITNAMIANLAVDGAKIANAAIVEAKIADASITNAKIGNAAITDAKIATATITAASIANATITGAKIASATITAANITDATITGAKIGSATITGANIANATIGGANIGSATITGANIASATIGAANIASATITGANIASATITDANIGSLNAGKITAGTLDAARIAAGSLDAKIVNIDSAVIQSGTINVARIPNLSADKITSGFINAARIDVGSIDAKIATIGSAQISGLAAGKIESGSISVGRFIESQSYSAANGTGWRINADGSAFFNNVSVRGQINTGSYTGYAWPASGGNGVHLSNSGLLMGNFNGGAGFFQWETSTGTLAVGRGGVIKMQLNSAGNLIIRGKVIAGEGTPNGQVELGADVTSPGHYGLSLSQSNFNNIFIRRNDGVAFFRVNSYSGSPSFIDFDSAGGLDIVTPNFKVYRNGTGDIDQLNIRRRPVIQTGSFDTQTIIYSGYSHGAGAIFRGQISAIIPTDVYDQWAAFNGTLGQRFGVSTVADGAFRNWFGTAGSTFYLQIIGHPTTNRTFSNTGNFNNDNRIYIAFEYQLSIVSGSFDSFRLPWIAWTLYRL